MNPSYIAVIDIGKTNKKVLIFDRDLTLQDSVYRGIEEYEEDGVRYENVTETWQWVAEQLRTLTRRYRIAAVSVTTHGATAMCLDADGNLAVPPVAYTTEAGEEFRQDFYDKFGDPSALQRETCTAEVGSLINVAKLLYFQKKRWPERFERIAHVLYYPQYFGYLLTGVCGAEPTYTGCHTYLYDPHTHKPSSVARGLGVVDKMPACGARSWEVLGRVRPDVARDTGLPEDCIVTMGIHDSNSSLLPYLVQGHGDFVLNSTGTWCVAMRPANSLEFAENELGKLVFFNLSAFNQPVKTSIFMGGLEFAEYTGLLEQIHGTSEHPPLDLDLYTQVAGAQAQFILPSVVRGTGIFPDACPRVVDGDAVYPLEDLRSGTIPELFRDYARSRAVLTLSLAIQTKAALDMVGFDGSGAVFTEGGFRRNHAYNTVLAALYPEARVALTQLEEATAFGAAMLGKAALEGTTPMDMADRFEIETRAVGSHAIPGLDAYARKFSDMLAG